MSRGLDASDIFAGLGSFIWGDRQEGPFPFIGARSLSSVRAAVATAFRNQLQSPLVRESIGGSDTSALPPAMSLVGAVGARGYFDQIPLHGATQGDIYFQNAGMDACSLTIGDQPHRNLELNRLNHISVPELTAPLDVEAICFQGDRSFTKKVRFVN